MRFQIIEKVKTEDLSDSNTIRKRRIDRELFWISRLRTAHPLGLNDKVSGLGMHGNLSDPRFVDYNMYRVVNVCEKQRQVPRRGRHNKKNRDSITDDELVRFRAELLECPDLCNVERLISSKGQKFLERYVSSPMQI